MGVKKIEYIPAKNLSSEIKGKYKIKDNEFAQIRVVNPNEGIEVKRIKSPIDEVRKSFQNKKLKNFQI